MSEIVVPAGWVQIPCTESDELRECLRGEAAWGEDGEYVNAWHRGDECVVIDVLPREPAECSHWKPPTDG